MNIFLEWWPEPLMPLWFIGTGPSYDRNVYIIYYNMPLLLHDFACI